MSTLLTVDNFWELSLEEVIVVQHQAVRMAEITAWENRGNKDFVETPQQLQMLRWSQKNCSAL